MSTVSIIIIVLILAIFILLVLGVIIYNTLIKKRVSCENAWSQIDVQLKRRHDLVPNLVETVKAYASHEKETLDAVIQARSGAMSASGSGELGQAQAENILTGALKSLFALQENYPDLKANQNFLSLQEEISSTENKIAFARQHYNDMTGTYVTQLETFPSNFIADYFDFKSREFFEMEEEEFAAASVPPQLNF